jgi:glucosyl-dolichyl phosphate glucuronosyltransferase
MDISVVICAFSERRWRDLGAAIDSLHRQARPAREIIVVIDHNERLLARATSTWPGASVVRNEHSRGLSGARNSGASAASADIVAFLDDDAEADERWLERLAAAYDDPRVLAAGGLVEPQWPAGRPRWFPAEFDWVVGCAHSGMPHEAAPVRNLIGANMSFRRQTLAELGGFRDGIGRIGRLPVGCEETELCIRARQRWPDRFTLYLPDARVRHVVSVERTSPRYFLSRCHAEGRSKAVVARLVGRDDGLETERDYVRRTLTAGIARGLWDAARRKGSFGKPLAILLGLAATTAGYISEMLRIGLQLRRRRLRTHSAAFGDG